jgi:hypothetical protein
VAEKVLEPPIVHIYPPRFPHDPVEIVGNRRGLERLIGVLIDGVTLEKGSSVLYSSDGYASEVRVAHLPGNRRPEEWQRSGSPHWDIDDPLIAQIVDLSSENRRLRKVIAMLRCERKSIVAVDPLGEPGAGDDGSLLPE